MKRVSLALAILLVFTLPSAAFAGDGAQLRRANFAVGYHLNNFRYDFGYGLNVTSPYFKNAPSCFFIELGSVGSGIKAEKIAGKPYYAAGFAVAAGFRYHF